MNLNLFLVILFGGIPVLSSYYILLLNGNENITYTLWGGIRGSLFYVWVVSMCLTIISYFYLFYMFVWGIQNAFVFDWTSDEIEPWLCAIYTVFLGSASQFAFIALDNVQNKRKTCFLAFNLWLTALSSLLIGVSAIAINGVSDFHNISSICAGFIISIHHILFDAIFWFITFEPQYSSEILY